MIAASIRARLLVSVAAIQIAGAAVATYLVVEHERYQTYVAFDAQLGEEAAVVRSLLEPPEDTRGNIVFHREFLALPGTDRFLITDAKGTRIDGSADWTAATPLPPEARKVINLSMGNTLYRALALQKLAIVDPESQPTPASPTVTLLYASPVAPIELHIRHVEVQAVGACLVLLALSTLVSAWALTRGLRPLRNLASSAEHIDVGRWALPQLEESRRITELKPLARSLAELVDRLHAAFDRERQFFGDAAHEMKSSVAIVRSTLQFALQADRDAAAYRKELEDALADTARLQDLVAGMLDLARIERPARLDTTRELSPATEVHAEAHRVMDRLRPLATQKGIRVDLSADDKSTDMREAWVHMAGEDLQTVLSNLLENAILYSDPGQRVTIQVSRDGGLCCIRVRDQGCGISPSALPHIFDRFYRGDASRSRVTGGVGLGLSIARALVQRSQGTISVESRPGEGSVFTILLPSVQQQI